MPTKKRYRKKKEKIVYFNTLPTVLFNIIKEYTQPEQQKYRSGEDYYNKLPRPMDATTLLYFSRLSNETSVTIEYPTVYGVMEYPYKFKAYNSESGKVLYEYDGSQYLHCVSEDKGETILKCLHGHRFLIPKYPNNKIWYNIIYGIINV